jgi:hypothetical protein
VGDSWLFRELLTAERVRAIQASSSIVLRNSSAVLYGDPAYCLSDVIEKRAVRVLDESLEAQINAKNSGARVAVEWYYGVVQSKWHLTAEKYKARVLQCPVASVYRVAAFLANIHTCMYGSIISQTFGVAPPRLQEYMESFQMIPDLPEYRVNQFLL